MISTTGIHKLYDGTSDVASLGLPIRMLLSAPVLSFFYDTLDQIELKSSETKGATSCVVQCL